MSVYFRLYMNHVPYPRNDHSPSLEIPYICDDLVDYDGLEFSEYPSRRGWSVEGDKFHWMKAPPVLVAKRAQNWLYFGLLQVFLGPLFDKQDFISSSGRSNGRVLDSCLLPHRLLDLVRTIKHGAASSIEGLHDRDKLRDEWNVAFLEAKLHLAVLEPYVNQKSIVADGTLRLFSAPIVLLLQSLQHAAEAIYGHDQTPPAMCTVQIGAALLSVWRMLEVERCHTQVQTLYYQYSAFLNHYISGLPRSQLKSNHDHCPEIRCIGNNVDESSYKTQHVHECCSCMFVGPDPVQLEHTINHDGIPLVELRIVHGRPRLSIIPATLGHNYVTISHVWAGGLGNFKENTLPTCQLLKLFDLLIKLDHFRPGEPRDIIFPFQEMDWYIFGIRLLSLAKRFLIFTVSLLRIVAARILQMDKYLTAGEPSPPVFFWMDTLCIPVDPRRRDLRIKAIGNMALTYAAAERCLVLDPELQHISMGGLEITQLNAYVLCSSWLTRSWTFQEAKLSRAWYAQFADGFYNPNCEENAALYSGLYNACLVYRDDSHRLDGEMIQWYHDMPAVRQTDLYANQSTRFLSESFVTVWNHLASRSTSKMDDVPAILANTLDLSAPEVLELPPERRMQAILRAQEKLPVAIIYNNARKISNGSCRWVPSYPEASRLSMHYGSLQRSRDGFYLDKIDGDPVGFLVDPSIPRYENICLSDSEGSSPLWISISAESEGPSTSYAAPGDYTKVCYVMGDLRQSLADQSMTYPSRGARFALRKKEGKTLHLVFEYSFRYSHHRPHLYSQETVFETVHGERTDTDAVFHVDSDLDTWPVLRYRRDTADQKSSHGLHVYIASLFAGIVVIWSPFTYLSGISSRSPSLIHFLLLLKIKIEFEVQCRRSSLYSEPLATKVAQSSQPSWVTRSSLPSTRSVP